MLKEMFEPGKRKLIMTIIAMVVAVLLEKFGGGLSPDLKQFILSAVGIYAGTNVLSKGIRAIENVKTGVSDSFDDGPMKDQIQKIIAHVNNLDNVAGQKLQELHEKVEGISTPIVDLSKVDALEERINITTNNVTKLIDLVNRLGSK